MEGALFVDQIWPTMGEALPPPDYTMGFWPRTPGSHFFLNYQFPSR